MDKEEFIKLKQENLLKFFEILPDYLSWEIVKQIKKINIAMNLGIDNNVINDIISDKSKEVDDSSKNNNDLRKVLIGGSIYVLGNTILHLLNKKDDNG